MHKGKKKKEIGRREGERGFELRAENFVSHKNKIDQAKLGGNFRPMQHFKDVQYPQKCGKFSVNFIHDV